MFWLLSLLMPSLRREDGQVKFDDVSALLKSPQTRGWIFQILGIVGVLAFLWVIIAAILSLLNAWFVVLLALVLGCVVGVREIQRQRREQWISQGCCAQCGYDLRATPEICPECGRDARLDEPTWRRMRRELEAKLAAQADVSEQLPLPVTPIEQEPIKKARIVIRRPDEDTAPIPLEETEPSKTLPD